MTNSYSVSFSVAGPRETINKAILLMAKNIFEQTGGKEPVSVGDAAESYKRYCSLISKGYVGAFAGKKSTGRYLSEAASVFFQDNGKLCAFALRYSCDGGPNKNDLDFLLESLSKTIGPSEGARACTLDAGEEGRYEDVSVSTAKIGQDIVSRISQKDLESGRLFMQLRECYRPNPKSNDVPEIDLNGIDDPDELALKLATTLWSDWGTASVIITLCNLGILPWDKEEACEIFGEEEEAVINHFLAGKDSPFKVTRWDQK